MPTLAAIAADSALCSHIGIGWFTFLQMLRTVPTIEVRYRMGPPIVGAVDSRNFQDNMLASQVTGLAFGSPIDLTMAPEVRSR